MEAGGSETWESWKFIGAERCAATGLERVKIAYLSPGDMIQNLVLKFR